MIQDERAHKCSNVILPRSDLLPDPTGFLVSGHCLGVSQFREHTDRSVRDIQTRLKDLAGNGAPGELASKQTRLGFLYSEHSLLQD
eukprot:9471656-Pyramimonas_sp.AAC.1